MPSCGRCGAPIVWARSFDGGRWLRPLEPKAEGLVPDTDEVVVDLVDGEWRAVAVPTVRIHRFHYCLGTSMPEMDPTPSRRETSSYGRQAVSGRPGYDVNGDLIPKRQIKLPAVPGADRILREQQEKFRVEYAARQRQEAQQRANRNWSSERGIEALKWSCAACFAAPGERCTNLSRNTVNFGKALGNPHAGRDLDKVVGVEFAPFEPDEELGHNERSALMSFLRDNATLFDSCS